MGTDCEDCRSSAWETDYMTLGERFGEVIDDANRSIGNIDGADMCESFIVALFQQGVINRALQAALKAEVHRCLDIESTWSKAPEQRKEDGHRLDRAVRTMYERAKRVDPSRPVHRAFAVMCTEFSAQDYIPFETEHALDDGMKAALHRTGFEQ